MSKAFTREDDASDEPILWRQPDPLPPGVKNYITPEGANRLRQELEQLVHVERPRALAAAEASGVRRELQALDQRIAYLSQSIQSVVIVPPPETSDVVIRFGATVAVRETSGSESTYRIVGIDETDMDRGWVSWRSPIARALLNARVGQRVKFRLPAGEEELEIVHVSYHSEATTN